MIDNKDQLSLPRTLTLGTMVRFLIKKREFSLFSIFIRTSQIKIDNMEDMLKDSKEQDAYRLENREKKD